MNWIPRNKTTGVEYDPVTDAEKAAMEADRQTKGKYTFRATSNVPEKKSAQKAETKKEKSTPIGVDISNEPNEEKELPQA